MSSRAFSRDYSKEVGTLQDRELLVPTLCAWERTSGRSASRIIRSRSVFGWLKADWTTRQLGVRDAERPDVRSHAERGNEG